MKTGGKDSVSSLPQTLQILFRHVELERGTAIQRLKHRMRHQFLLSLVSISIHTRVELLQIKTQGPVLDMPYAKYQLKYLGPINYTRHVDTGLFCHFCHITDEATNK